MQRQFKNSRQTSLFEFVVSKKERKDVSYDSLLHSSSILAKCSYEGDGNPMLVFDLYSGVAIRKKVMPIGKAFSIRLDKNNQETHCTGWYDIATFNEHNCPEGAIVFPKRYQCDQCLSRTSFNPAMYFTPDRMSAAQVAYSNEPHVVYLAYFGKNTLKVGTANRKRIVTRWGEQGARAAAIIAECPDAFAATTIESRISKIFSVPQGVTKKNKMNLLLNNGYVYSSARDELMSLYRRLSTKRDLGLLDEISVVDMNPHYYGGYEEIGGWMGIINQRGTIAGKCVACIGSIIVMKKGDLVYLTELSEFYGRVFK